MVAERAVLPGKGERTGGRTGGSTADWWQNGRFYRGRATEGVVERVVLPRNGGRTGGSTREGRQSGWQNEGGPMGGAHARSGLGEIIVGL